MTEVNAVSFFGLTRKLAMLPGVALALASLFGAAAVAAGDDVPSWKRPVPGTAAILGDDGGGESAATVCDSASHYHEWLDYKHPPGCKKFHHGLNVIIQGLVSHAMNEAISSKIGSRPLVRIFIPARNFTGYLQLFGGIHPKIPQGTLLHLRREGTSTLRLAASRDADLDDGLDLGDQATATIGRYDPSTDDRTLFITVTDGPRAGKSGWVFSMDAHGDDGDPIGFFAFSLLNQGQTIPDSYVYHEPSAEDPNEPFTKVALDQKFARGLRFPLTLNELQKKLGSKGKLDDPGPSPEERSHNYRWINMEDDGSGDGSYGDFGIRDGKITYIWIQTHNEKTSSEPRVGSSTR